MKNKRLVVGIVFFFVSIIFSLIIFNYSKILALFEQKPEKIAFEDVNIPLPYESSQVVNENDVKGATTSKYIKLPVLMYHQIATMPKTGSKFYKGLFVEPSMFEQQMAYLNSHGYKTITPAQFYSYLKAGKTPSSKLVLLTFDDGSVGQYKYAYPILKKYKMTGTFYIIESKNDITKSQLKRMSNNGMVIDSHTMLHKDLRALNSKKQIKYEVDQSKQLLESLTGKQIVSIAYPGCVADGDVFNQVATSGYKLGFSCGTTIYHQFKNRYYLSRIHVFSNMESFRKALTVGL